MIHTCTQTHLFFSSVKIYFCVLKSIMCNSINTLFSELIQFRSISFKQNKIMNIVCIQDKVTAILNSKIPVAVVGRKRRKIEIVIVVNKRSLKST